MMLRPGVLAALMVVAWGCASPGNIPLVQSEYWKGESFAAYERYTWALGDGRGREQTQVEDHRLHELIRAAVDEGLTARGYTLGPPAEADFLVTYHCRIAEQVQVDVIDRVWYGSDDGADWEEVTPRVELSSFDEGSIVIDIIDAATGRRVWRGVARGRVTLDAAPDQYQAIVDRSVRQILDAFPPPKS